MKLFLASLAIGIFIPALLVAILLTIKILAPGTTPTPLFWFFIWPVFGLRSMFPNLTSGQLLLISFPLGTLVNIGVMTLLAYFGLRRVKRRRRPQSVPPQPPTF